MSCEVSVCALKPDSHLTGDLRKLDDLQMLHMHHKTALLSGTILPK